MKDFDLDIGMRAWTDPYFYPRPPRNKSRRKTTKLQRARIFARDGRICRRCGKTKGLLQIDHIIPVCKGGTNDDANLQVLCSRCNASKGGRLETEATKP